MLQLIDIKKDYLSASDKVEALKGVSLTFGEREFVSILGPSGCGKTTLLNIIGGLDHYTDGDLVIDGKSTKHFSDSDWDNYRNHSIGFVFQSYNLIPHQSVLANVELALTLSGVSKAERRKRAVAALEKVGLKDQIKKRPNQLSGGQMQRVAIARALVNNPEILLADEPTGALDSATSLQIMELLKDISKEKLVIMVTHNPELAEEYSSRIIHLLDGKLVKDSKPHEAKRKEEAKSTEKKSKKPSMSFFTALSLSMNNLMTKKGRTVLTSFAGSIGIIGIALILSLSNGINAYIHSVQEETLSSYPITIQAKSTDMSAFLGTLMGINSATETKKHDLDAVYSSKVMNELVNSLTNPKIQTNNLTDFKKFLDQNEEIRQHITNLQYSYDLDLNVYTKDSTGLIVKSDVEALMKEVFKGIGVSDSAMTMGGSTATSFSSVKLWQEMLPEEDGSGIHSLVKEQYDLLYGSWPERYDEVVLVVNQNNELSDLILGSLGLVPTEKLIEDMKATQKGELLDTTAQSWSYEEVCEKEFKIFLPTDLYQKNLNGGYTRLTDTEKGLDYLFESDKGTTVKISGIIRQNQDVSTPMLTGALGYTAALTEYFLEETSKSSIIKEQLDAPETDVLLNLPFRPDDFEDYSSEEKASMIREYLLGLTDEEKARIYIEFSSLPSQSYLDAAIEGQIGGMDRAQLEAFIFQNMAQNEAEGVDTSYIQDYLAQMSDDKLFETIKDEMEKVITEQYKAQVKDAMAKIPATYLAAEFTGKLTSPQGLTEEEMITLYDNHMPPTHSDSNLEENLILLGQVEKESPGAVNIYTDTFEKKDRIAELIEGYNDTKEEKDKIRYTDLFAMLMSGIATIINAISYVLIAFVSISLIVSSIMIGIITYISVLERTKEIGILRAIGASKKDVSRVFNAESIIEGFAAGIIGIGITLLLIIPINILIRHLTGIESLGAALPPAGYLLIAVSVLLSFIAGLLPSRFAAKKDPVEALRTE